jgi:uncharacterized protein (DUF1697 family)
MNTWIALFRGINVGGKNFLPMAELKRQLKSAGCTNVRTYIQSGNAVFESSARRPAPLAKKIASQVQSSHGFRPQVIVLSGTNLQAALDHNPFPAAEQLPTTLHFFFLSEPAFAADIRGLEAAQSGSEQFQLTDQVFYLLAPDGLGRSKLAAKAEKLLGVPATARNFRTVRKLLEMVEQR